MIENKKLNLICIITCSLTLSFTSCKNINSNERISKVAERKVGSYFRKGESRQCANFVSHVLNESGIDFQTPMAQGFKKIGKPIKSPHMLKDGDILLFAKTYNGPNYITHVGLYNDGYVIHRPTFSGPVKKQPFEGYYLSKFVEARRL